MLPHILTLDLGTAGCKVVVFSIEGEIIGSGYDSYPISQQHAGWVEQDPEAWWASSIRASREALRNSKIDSSAIEVIGVTGQMSGIVPLDKRGSPLRPSIIWMDRRAVSQAERLRKHLGGKYLYEITGHRIDPAFFAVKAMWIKENEPEIFKRTHIFLMPKDYLRFRLTGLFATDHGDASGSMLLDLRKKDWSSKLLAELDIPPEKLPILKRPNEIAGDISAEASRLMGLPTDTPVTVGSGDAICATLGAGVSEEGVCHDVTGTSTIASVCADEPVIDRKMRVITNCYGVEGKWLIEAPSSTSGAILNWFKDCFAGEEASIAGKTGRDVFELLSEEAAHIKPGADGLMLLPYFQGERSPMWDPEARGVIAGLTLAHTKSHAIRGIFESTSYLLRDLIETIEDLGISVKEVRATGGGSKSRFWLQTKADVTGRNIKSLKVRETSPLGAMILASCAVHYYRDTREAIENVLKVEEIFEPDRSLHDLYSQNFSIYKEIYQRMKGIRFG